MKMHGKYETLISFECFEGSIPGEGSTKFKDHHVVVLGETPCLLLYYSSMPPAPIVPTDHSLDLHFGVSSNNSSSFGFWK